MDALKLPPDVVDYVRRTFPTLMVDYALAQLPEHTTSPRLQRCIVFASQGHRWHFDYLCRLVNLDFRDVIMAAEYTRTDDRLYDFNMPIPEATLEHPFTSET
jgi:hypothetical protein